MKGKLKHLAKKYLKYYLISERFKPEVRIEQFSLVELYRKGMISGQLPSLADTGFKVFSQYEEDGLLLYLFSLIGFTKRSFVEFGSDDGVNSNAANLYFNHDFTGLFIDGNEEAIERGRHFYKRHKNPACQDVQFTHAKITAENINELISNGGLNGEIGLLSIDIDGNDYWVWKAIDVISPQVVIIETHNEFGLHSIVVPYDPNYSFPGKHPDYHGASPVAMTKLAADKGYRLVGANELGFNFIYLRNDLLTDSIPEVSVEGLLNHPTNMLAQKRFEAIKDWDYIRV